MKNVIFRPVEFWKASITTLPDTAFFELLRTVFGKIKTPFNKQILMDDLEKFLSRSDIKKNIACYIDKNDRCIIAAIAALNEPTPGDMEIFHSNELSYAVLHDLVVNLEERFIIYRFWEDKKSRLALNPVLKSILSPIASDRSLLFPSVCIDEVPQNTAVLFDDRILAALLSFVSQNTEFYRSAGTIRQKVLNSSKKAFPNLPLQTIIGALRILGLFYTSDENLLPDYGRFSSFGSLSRQERMEYCAAGIYCYRDSVPPRESGNYRGDAFSISPWLLREKVQYCASFIHQFICLLDTKRLYPITTLQKFLFLLNRSNQAINSGMIIEAMERTGLLVPESKQYRLALPIEESAAPVAAMDTPFSLLVYPEIAYNDAINLSAVSKVVEAGLNVRFELSRETAVLAFNRGISAGTIIELLRRLSHNRIDENLIFALHDWEKLHSEVVLRKGLVLTLSPERRYLAETKPLSLMITETIAPGIYLLPQTAENKAAEALHKAGVDIVARRRNQDGDESSGRPTRGFFMPLHTSAPHQDRIQHTPPAAKSGSLPDTSASVLIGGFHSILNKMQLGLEERDELAARIDRRLVLCETQLKNALVRYEKLAARGLDYAGKAMIAKQAISMQSPVEVVCPGRHNQEHIFGIPKALEKAGGESILIIESPDDQGNAIRVPLGKISMLRRIKKSIFETVI